MPGSNLQTDIVQHLYAAIGHVDLTYLDAAALESRVLLGAETASGSRLLGLVQFRDFLQAAVYRVSRRPTRMRWSM